LKKWKTKAGFNLIEMLIVLSVVALLSAVALPHFNEAKNNGLTKKLMLTVFNLFELGQSEAIKRNRDINLYYVPSTQTTKGCIGLSEKVLADFSCHLSDGALAKLILENQEIFKLSGSVMTEKTKITHFDPLTGLPSHNNTLSFSHHNTKSEVVLRRYVGIKGCSDIKISNWPLCT
jgi:type IV fimbrial biogenesis protein FimT